MHRVTPRIRLSSGQLFRRLTFYQDARVVDRLLPQSHDVVCSPGSESRCGQEFGGHLTGGPMLAIDLVVQLAHGRLRNAAGEFLDRPLHSWMLAESGFPPPDPPPLARTHPPPPPHHHHLHPPT